MHRTKVRKVVLEGVLDANDALAKANRENFDQAETYVINMIVVHSHIHNGHDHDHG